MEAGNNILLAVKQQITIFFLTPNGGGVWKVCTQCGHAVFWCGRGPWCDELWTWIWLGLNVVHIDVEWSGSFISDMKKLGSNFDRDERWEYVVW